MVVNINVCCSFCHGIPIRMRSFFRRLRPNNLMCFEVHKLTNIGMFNHYDGLVCIRKWCVGKRKNSSCGRVGSPFIELVEGEKSLFFARYLINDATFLNIKVYQFVAPPGCPPVFGNHIMVVLSTKIEVFESKLLQILSACLLHKLRAYEADYGQKGRRHEFNLHLRIVYSYQISVRLCGHFRL